jgi:hypothetical protein
MRTLKTLVMLAAVAAVVAPVAARAESAIHANIPFEFAVAGVTLPAGNYHFEKQHNSKAMTVWSLDRHTRFIVLANPAYASPRARIESRVVFNKYGNRYFLAEVWSAADALGSRVIKSHEEREASLKVSAQTVLVAAR